MIRGFHDRETEAIFARRGSRRFSRAVQRAAQKKLVMLHAAGRLDDLQVPPGNRLERLRGDRSGQCSIRVNDQFRICFRWTDGGAIDVELTDYH